MGSKQSQPQRKRNSYSLDNFEYSLDSKIKPVNIDIINSQHHLQPLEKRQTFRQISHSSSIRYKEQGIGDGSVSVNNTENSDKKLSKLNAKNDQLRGQLIRISNQLGQKLKKKKATDIFKYQSKKDGKTSTALQRQLDNAYRQIDLYKQKIEKYKLSMAGNPQTINSRIQRIEDQITSMDIKIGQYKSQILGFRNIHKGQEIAIQKNVEQLQSQDVYKRQIESLKRRLKEFKNKDRQRQDKLKFQQQTMYQLQKKVSGINGDYYPDLQKKKLKEKEHQKNSRVIEQDRQLPTRQEMLLVQEEAINLKLKHDDYKRKLQSLTKNKTDLKEKKTEMQKQLKAKENLIEGLKSKRDVLFKVTKSYEEAQKAKPDELSEFSSGNSEEQQQQSPDVFDINHLKEELPKRQDKGQSSLAISQAKSQLKKWQKQITRVLSKGEKHKDEKTFSDEDLFTSNSNSEVLMVGMNIWLSKQKQIMAIQGVYFSNDQVKQGHKTSKSDEEYVIRYELSEGDYIKSIVGLFGKEGFLDYLMIRSKKNKLKKYGRQPSNPQRLACGLSQNQRPMFLSGASVMDQQIWRINKLSVEVCLF